MEKLRRGIGLVLILIGVGIIGVTAYKKIITNQKQKQLIDMFENQISEGTINSATNEAKDDGEIVRLL